jgi:hypothetical protein
MVVFGFLTEGGREGFRTVYMFSRKGMIAFGISVLLTQKEPNLIIPVYERTQIYGVKSYCR